MRMPGRDKGDAVRKSWMKSARRLPSPTWGMSRPTSGLSSLLVPEAQACCFAPNGAQLRPPYGSGRQKVYGSF
jgi:hypothetical protein